MGNVTIYAVAARAGVAISTVSRTLNTPERVGPDTRSKVLAAVDELGFVPKEIAVTRARRGVGRVGVIAPITPYDSYGKRLEGVLLAARPSGLEVVVYDHESAAGAETPLLRTLPITGHLDGLILMGLPLAAEAAESLRAQELPVVLVDVMEVHGFTAVTVDDELGGYMLGRHLAERGHRKLAYVHEEQRSWSYTSPGQRRLAGLRRAWEEASLSPRSITQVLVANALDGGRRAVPDLLGTKGVTAAVAHHDLLAAGLLSGLRAHGVDVPGAFSVAGFDDGPLADALGLTTVRQPFRESGRVALDLLAAAIRGTASVSQVSLHLELVVRDST